MELEPVLETFLSRCLFRQWSDYNLCNNNNTNNDKLVIIGATGTISKLFRQYVSNIPGNTTLGNYRKLPYWALHTYFGKC
jgi:hypothetical protein